MEWKEFSHTTSGLREFDPTLERIARRSLNLSYSAAQKISRVFKIKALPKAAKVIKGVCMVSIGA